MCKLSPRRKFSFTPHAKPPEKRNALNNAPNQRFENGTKRTTTERYGSIVIRRRGQVCSGADLSALRKDFSVFLEKSRRRGQSKELFSLIRSVKNSRHRRRSFGRAARRRHCGLATACDLVLATTFFGAIRLPEVKSVSFRDGDGDFAPVTHRKNAPSPSPRRTLNSTPRQPGDFGLLSEVFAADR